MSVLREIESRINDTGDDRAISATGEPQSGCCQIIHQIIQQLATATTAWIFSLAVVFVVSFCSCMWFNFDFPHPDVSYFGDSGAYTEEARGCLNLGNLAAQVVSIQLEKHATPAQLKQIVETGDLPMPDFRMNGPVFPIAIAALYACTRIDVAPAYWHASSWYLPVSAQSFLTAINCVLIALVGRVLWSAPVGVVAGLLAAAYPGFIVNSGRITTENVACTMILSCLLLVCRLRKQKHPYLFGGAIGALLMLMQLTRSVLVLLWLLLAPVALLKLRRRTVIKAAVAMIALGALTAVPWLTWQESKFGQAKLIVDRAGKFNLYVGNDVERQGWLSVVPPIPQAVMSMSSQRILWKCFKDSPWRFIQLQFDKPPRVFKEPWNDFRIPIGKFDFASQVLFHQLLLALAVVGLCLSVFSRDTGKMIVRLMLCEVLMLHFVYFAFAPVARYGLTAMPAVILLASAVLVQLWRAVRGRTPAISPDQSQPVPTDSGSTSKAFPKFRSGRGKPILDSPAGGDAPPLPVSLLWTRCTSLIQHPAIQAISATVLLVVCSRLEQFVPLVAALDKVNGTVCTVVIAGAKLLVLTLFVLAIRRVASRIEMPRVGKAIPVVLGLVLLPFVVLPLRSYGRLEERTVGLTVPLTRSIQVAKDEFAATKCGQCYLAVDAPDLTTVNNGISIDINGTKIETAAIAGGALMDCGRPSIFPGVFTFRDFIFSILSQSSRIDNTGFRQWFFIPVSHELLQASNGQLRITVQGADQKSVPYLFATERGMSKQWHVPSLSIYSVDKAFYGVENDAGITDPRFDMRVPVNSAESACRQIPNVFLVVTSPPSVGGSVEREDTTLLSYKDVPPAPTSGSTEQENITRLPYKDVPLQQEYITRLLHKDIPPQQVGATRHAQSQLTIDKLPPCGADDLWLIRVRGQARADGLVASGINVSVKLQPAKDDWHTSYNCEYAPVLLKASPEWSNFDELIPLSRRSLGNHPIGAFNVQFNGLSTERLSYNNPFTDEGVAQFRNLSLDIYRAPGNPVDSCRRIY